MQTARRRTSNPSEEEDSFNAITLHCEPRVNCGLIIAYSFPNAIGRCIATTGKISRAIELVWGIRSTIHPISFSLAASSLFLVKEGT